MRYKTIFNFVEKLVKDYDSRDPLQIARAQNIRVYSSAFQKNSCASYLHSVQTRAFVLADTLNEIDQHFLLAQMLGYYYLYPKFLARKCYILQKEVYNFHSTCSKEASSFAVFLLLDPSKVKESLESPSSLQQLSNLFALDPRPLQLWFNLAVRLGFQSDLPWVKDDISKLKQSWINQPKLSSWL